MSFPGIRFDPTEMAASSAAALRARSRTWDRAVLSRRLASNRASTDAFASDLASDAVGRPDGDRPALDLVLGIVTLLAGRQPGQGQGQGEKTEKFFIFLLEIRLVGHGTPPVSGLKRLDHRNY